MRVLRNKLKSTLSKERALLRFGADPSRLIAFLSPALDFSSRLYFPSLRCKRRHWARANTHSLYFWPKVSYSQKKETFILCVLFGASAGCYVTPLNNLKRERKEAPSCPYKLFRRVQIKKLSQYKYTHVRVRVHVYAHTHKV